MHRFAFIGLAQPATGEAARLRQVFGITHFCDTLTASSTPSMQYMLPDLS
jgi:hypothetical protein